MRLCCVDEWRNVATIQGTRQQQDPQRQFTVTHIYIDTQQQVSAQTARVPPAGVCCSLDVRKVASLVCSSKEVGQNPNPYLFGRKSTNLCTTIEMNAQHELNVPPFCCVSALAFLHFLDLIFLRPKIHEILHRFSWRTLRTEEAYELSHEIRYLFLCKMAEFSQHPYICEVVDEITEQVAMIPGGCDQVLFRSSSSIEDNAFPSQSFAGVFVTSEAFKPTQDLVRRKLALVWAGQYSAGAVALLPPAVLEAQQMSVLCMKYVSGEVETVSSECLEDQSNRIREIVACCKNALRTEVVCELGCNSGKDDPNPHLVQARPLPGEVRRRKRQDNHSDLLTLSWSELVCRLDEVENHILPQMNQAAEQCEMLLHDGYHSAEEKRAELQKYVEYWCAIYVSELIPPAELLRKFGDAWAAIQDASANAYDFVGVLFQYVAEHNILGGFATTARLGSVTNGRGDVSTVRQGLRVAVEALYGTEVEEKELKKATKRITTYLQTREEKRTATEQMKKHAPIQDPTLASMLPVAARALVIRENDNLVLARIHSMALRGGVPPNLINTPLNMPTNRLSGMLAVSAGRLTGTAVVDGHVAGRARVPLTAQEALQISPDEILVVDALDPSLCWIAAAAAGVVERRGGRFVHSSILCRERGIVCVVGVRECTRLISTGDWVTVDAANGVGVVRMELPCTDM